MNKAPACQTQNIIRGSSVEEEKEQHQYLKAEKKHLWYLCISIQIPIYSTTQYSQFLTFLVILKYAVIGLISIIFRSTIVV